MDKLEEFQSRFGKIDEFGLWDLKRFSSDSGMELYFTEIQDECQNHFICLTLAAQKHQ